MGHPDRWRKRRCRFDEKLVCWATLRIITKGETYYEYETAEGMANIVVNDKEYFKQALKGFKGFDFYEK